MKIVKNSQEHRILSFMLKNRGFVSHLDIANGVGGKYIIVADGYLWEAKNLMDIARKYENHCYYCKKESNL